MMSGRIGTRAQLELLWQKDHSGHILFHHRGGSDKPKNDTELLDPQDIAQEFLGGTSDWSNAGLLQLEQEFEIIDANGDGFIDRAEWEASQHSKNAVGTMSWHSMTQM